MEIIVALTCFGVILLLYMCLRTLRQIQAFSASSLKVLEPYDPFANLANDPKDPLASTSRTVLDQVLKELQASSERIEDRLSRIEAETGYLRSYVWEVRDPRSFEHVSKGEYSTTWKKHFSSLGSEDFLIHRRESDYDAGFHKPEPNR